MNNYTQLKCEFWTSPLVVKLSPQEKFFLLFLVTNPNILSIDFEIDYEEVCNMTGYTEKTLYALFNRFVEFGHLEGCEEGFKLKDEFNHFLKIEV